MALVRVSKIVRRRLDPLFRFRDWLLFLFVDYIDGFEDFSTGEARRQWHWSNKYELEIKYWKSAVGYFQHMFLTFLYLSFAPPSFVRGIFIPMFLGLFMHERLWTSPQAVMVYLTFPFKWRPGYSFSFF